MAKVTGLRNYSDIAAGVTVRAGEECEVPDRAVGALEAHGVIAPVEKPKKKTAARSE